MNLNDMTFEVPQSRLVACPCGGPADHPILVGSACVEVSV